MEYIEAKTILSGYRENNSWFGYHYNMNIYKGCCHGCIYCDSRSDCYGVEDFDRVRAKDSAIEILERDLRSKRKKGVVGTGAMSDPYNPFEKDARLTREALKRIDLNGFGVGITTKSTLIERDIDLLVQIAKHSPVIVKITVTTEDDSLCKLIEPNVAVTSERIRVIKELSKAGIYTGVLMMPILPYINDTIENIRGVTSATALHGARFIYPAFGVTLRQNQREWYYKQLEQKFPEVKEKYLEKYANTYECTSPDAGVLWKEFRDLCEKNKIRYKMDDIIEGYTSRYKVEQLSLFDINK